MWSWACQVEGKAEAETSLMFKSQTSSQCWNTERKGFGLIITWIDMYSEHSFKHCIMGAVTESLSCPVIICNRQGSYQFYFGHMAQNPALLCIPTSRLWWGIYFSLLLFQLLVHWSSCLLYPPIHPLEYQQNHFLKQKSNLTHSKKYSSTASPLFTKIKYKITRVVPKVIQIQLSSSRVSSLSVNWTHFPFPRLPVLGLYFCSCFPTLPSFFFV